MPELKDKGRGKYIKTNIDGYLVSYKSDRLYQLDYLRLNEDTCCMWIQKLG